MSVKEKNKNTKTQNTNTKTQNIIPTYANSMSVKEKQEHKVFYTIYMHIVIAEQNIDFQRFFRPRSSGQYLID